MGSRIKTYLKSEKAMSTINLVFFLSLLIRNKGIIFIAYLLWIGYLSYCIKSTSSKVMKTVFGILCVFAGVMVLGNLYLMLKMLIGS